MKEFAGLVRFDGESIDEASVARLRRAVTSAAPAAMWRPDPSTLFVEGRDAGEPMPGQIAPDRVLLADAVLDAPAEVARALGLGSVPDARRLCAAACARWGVERAIERLYGNAALAEWDVDRRRLTIARDPMGARPVFYVEAPHFVLFASTLQLLLAMPETSREIDEVTLAHTLTLAQRDPETTVYRHIRRAPPGTILVFEKERRTRTRWYDAGSIAKVRLGSDDAYVEAARERLDAAVAARLPAAGRVAAQLSGGFDSGGVVATAARLLGATGLDAYTRVPGGAHPDHGFDERRFAGLLVARYPGIDWHIVDDASDPDRDLDPEHEAGMAMVPSAAGYNAGWFRSMRAAIEQRSPAVLLSGAFGNYTLSYTGAPEFAANLRRGRFDRMARDVRGVARLRDCSVPRAAMSSLYQALMPETLRRAHRKGGERPWLAYCLASPDFLDSLDYAERARERQHALPFEFGSGSAEARLRLIQDQSATDFRGAVVRKWAVPGAQPYRDRRLVEFCLGIPDDQYWRDGQGRWLARRVLADRVPAETLAQVRRGRQVPEWHLLGTRRLGAMAAAIDRIERSPLASRVLDVPRMRALLESWPKDAESAHKTRLLHHNALSRGIAMGGFLRWIEGRND